jgi:exopolysaccharide biosynthesis polyprenyl glycosylphosphotransferase
MSLSEPRTTHSVASPTHRRRPAVLGLAPPPAALSGVRRGRDRLLRRGLVTADAGAALLAATVAVVLPLGDGLLPWALIAVPCVVLLAKLHHLYDRDGIRLRASTVDELPALLQVAALSALVTWLVGAGAVDDSFGRPQLLGLVLALIVLLTAGRAGARALAHRLLPAERYLFIGDAHGAEDFADKLGLNGVRAVVVARLAIDEAHELTALDPTSDRLYEVRRTIRDLDVQRVVIAPSEQDPAAVSDLIRTLESLDVRISIVPRTLDVVGSAVALDELEGMTLLGVRRFVLSRSARVAKRSFDLVAATSGLVIVAPVLFAIAALVRLDSRGPVFFRQQRIGRDGERFAILKFRTMVVDAEHRKRDLLDLNDGADGFFKIADDPRVTRVGRLLRRTSLDELPQLINVLRGEMSLVGPRPLIPEEDRQVPGWYRRRLELTPGMTGPWQVLGSSRVPLREMIALDYLYAANWSLWNDVKIVLHTVGFMLGRRGV